MTKHAKTLLLFLTTGVACSRSEPEPTTAPDPAQQEIQVQSGPVRAGNATARSEGAQKTGLTSGEVQAYVKDHRPEIQACYDNSAPGAARQPGRIDLAIEIHGNGYVRNPNFARDDFGDDALRGCVLAAIAKWRFPTWPGEGVMRVTLPFGLNPTR